MEKGKLILNSVSLAFLLAITIDALFSNWQINFFLVRINWFPLAGQHAISVLAICGLGYIMLYQRIKPWKAILSVLALSGIHEIIFGAFGGALYLGTPTIVYWTIFLALWIWTSTRLELKVWILPIGSIIISQAFRIVTRIPTSIDNQVALIPNAFEVLGWMIIPITYLITIRVQK